MNAYRKNILSIFIVFLFGFFVIHYWESFEKFILSFFSAASPIIVGFVIAYLVNILMTKYEKIYFPKKSHMKLIKKTRRPVCLTASALTLTGIVALVVAMVIPELVSCVKLLIAEIPPIIDKLLENKLISQTLPQTFVSALSEINWKESISKITDVLSSGIGATANILYSAVSGVISFTVTLFLSIIFAIYLLLSKERLANQLKTFLRIYLPPKFTDKLLYVSSVFNESFHRFIIGQCTEAVILGILCIIGMLIFRFPYPVMIGTLIGFTALIPIAGAFIGAAIGAVMIFTVSPIKALLFILFIIILQQIEENLFYPKVVGGKIGLPSLFVLIAITIGGGLFGIIGILVSVPVTSAIYSLIRTDIAKRKNNKPQKQTAN